VGNPGTSGALWVYAPGVVRQVYHRKWKVRDDMDGSIHDFDADIIETQSPTNHGDSGGPLVNDRGELVGVTQGVVVSQGTQLSLFIDLAEVRRFVDSTVQDRLHMAWSPDARGPMNISTGGAGMMTGNLTDLVKALSSADSKQKTKAAEALGEMGEKAKDAIPSLLKLLSDPDDFTKRTALSALVKIGLPNKTDVPLFANSLREPSVELRRYAASTLERMGADARGAAADLTAALGDNDPMVRQSVARALGKLGRDVKDNAVRPLELLLTDSNRDNRMAAAEGLADLYAASNDMESLKKMLKNQDTDVRGFAVKAFAKMGKAAKPVLPDLLEMAKSDTGDVRRATVQLLALVDPIDSKPGLNLVVESLSSGDKETKLAALAALGVLAKEAPSNVVGSVKEMTKDQEMKKAAIVALSKLGTVQKTAVTALAEMLKESDDESTDVITKAIVDLGPAAVPAVNEIIKLMDVSGMVVTPDDHARVNKYAAILAKIGKPAIPALRRGLARNANIRHWGCAKALGEMGPIARDAVRDLQILLAQEVNGFIRTDIEDAIRKILNQ
jgi:HEAT repeat protein